MKSILHFLGFATPALLLLAPPTQCFAMMSIAEVTKEKAKAMGIDIRTQAAGPDALWVELEFKTEGALKSFGRVDLEIREDAKLGGKLILSAALKERRPAAGHIVVGFTVTRANVNKAALRVVAGAPMDAVGYDLHLRDFIDLDAPEKPAEKVLDQPSEKPAPGKAPAAAKLADQAPAPVVTAS